MCKKSGVSGLIIVDLPHPENKAFSKKCKKNGITFVQLLSPTTSKQRMKQIIKDSHNMIYYISQSNTTGGKLKVSPKKILEEYSKIKKAWNDHSVAIEKFGRYPHRNKILNRKSTSMEENFLKQPNSSW